MNGMGSYCQDMSIFAAKGAESSCLIRWLFNGFWVLIIMFKIFKLFRISSSLFNSPKTVPVRLRWLLRFVLVISTQEFIFLYFLIIILSSIRANEYMSAVFMPKSRVALCFILIGNGGSSVQEWRQWGSRTATRIGREVKGEEKYPSVTRNRALSGTSDLAHVIQSDVWCQF